MDRRAIAKLQQVCEVRLGADTIAFCRDWLKKVTPSDHNVVALPKTVEQVREVLTVCDAYSIPVVPQGGNTGLVQASVPRPSVPSVVVSTTKMYHISVNPRTSSVHCEAGVILETAQRECAARGLKFPLDMGSKGSATIGGCVATNAGGIHYFRYGSLRANLLGVQAVLPTGNILDWRSTLRKDNTGYDLKQLLVGSEGTLAVITACDIEVRAAYRSRAVLRIATPSFESVVKLQAALSSAIGPSLAAFEVMDVEGVKAVGGSCSGQFTVVVELHVFGESTERELAACAEVIDRLGLEAEVGETETACNAMMHERESHPVKLAALGPIYKYDLTFPLDQFYSVVEFGRSLLEDPTQRDQILVTGYGHFGDGNVHLNVVDRSPDKRHEAFIKGTFSKAVYDFTHRKQGSISAEHGIGVEKKAYFIAYEPEENLSIMRTIRGAFDPKGLMNPGVMF